MILDRIYDAGRFSKTISWKKLKNALFVYTSYRIATATGKILNGGYLYSLSIEPNTSCNLRCIECPTGLNELKRPSGNISVEDFKYYLKDISPFLIYLILYFQGEPFLHKDFFKIIRIAKMENVYTATSTNAHYMNSENARKTVESGLDRLIISYDWYYARILFEI